MLIAYCLIVSLIGGVFLGVSMRLYDEWVEKNKSKRDE